MPSKYERYIPHEEIFLFNTGDSSRAWRSFGCHHIPELKAHRFLLWAPNAQSVSLVGDFNNWDRYARPMEKLDSGVWFCFLHGLSEGMYYKYCVTGCDGVQRLKADPFARFSQTRSESASVVWNGGGFQWSDEEYMKARGERRFETEPMSVYEVHAGSWMELPGEGPAYRRLGDALAEYCIDMGYTHVEFLPLTEHPYDGSWGYQVTGYFAPTSRYGNPDDFKYMVDTLHSAGLGVIMDWVPAHFPRDEHGLANFDGAALYECRERRMAEHPQWGTLIFDYASPQVQSFLMSSVCMFFEDYHVDGIRVDAVSSMLYLNFGRASGDYTPNIFGGDINLDAEAFLSKLNRAVLSEYPGAVTIAEEATAYPGVTAPVEEGGLGFSLKWNMGYMHDTLDYMSLVPYLRQRHHHKLSFSMVYAFDENYVLAYSHDEVVHGKKSMLSKMTGDYIQKFASLRLLYALQFAHPGKKHCFMGGEFGQFIEWDHARPLDWLLLDYPMHEGLRRFYRELNRLYTSTPALYRVDRSWEGFKWLNVDDNLRSSIAFMRSSAEDGSFVVCACNFSAHGHDDFVIGLPAAGALVEILSSDDTRFGGSGILNKKTIYTSEETFNDFPHSAELSLPPLTAVMFRFISGKEYMMQEDL